MSSMFPSSMLGTMERGKKHMQRAQVEKEPILLSVPDKGDSQVGPCKCRPDGATYPSGSQHKVDHHPRPSAIMLHNPSANIDANPGRRRREIIRLSLSLKLLK